MKKYEDKLSFTAYGNPFLTYKYKRTGMVEKDAGLLLSLTEELLAVMRDSLLDCEP